MSDIFERTSLLIGEKNLEKLKKAKVAIFGVGGVGGTVAETLLRSGIGAITLIDFDIVSISNLNRQILYAYEDIGKLKVETAKSKLLKINNDAVIATFAEKCDDTFFKNHSFKDYDFIIDAIDDCKGKLAIANYCVFNDIKFITCLGMGNRLDPSKVIYTYLDKTENDPLARKIRSIYRKSGLDLSKIECVFSTEMPQKNTLSPSSMMMVPSSAGLLISFKVIENIVK